MVFDFLYYCLYRVFALVKRGGEKDEVLASSFYAILLSTNTLSAFLTLRSVLPLHLINAYLLRGSFFMVFVIWYFACKNYFLTKGYYRRIVSCYEEKYPSKKTQAALLGIVYFLLSASTFILLAT